MENSNKFELISRPTVFTRNNRKAVLSSGQSIAVPSNTISSGATTGITQSTNITYRDVVLKLEVIPLVNNEDEVSMQIAFLNDNIVGSITIDGNDIPTIGTEELLTEVTIPNGETIILGGLITETDQDDETGVPILSKIPGIKRLFTSTTKTVTRDELIIFIQPRIVKDRSSLLTLQEMNEQNSEIVRTIREEERNRYAQPVYQGSEKNAPTYEDQTRSQKQRSPMNSRFRGRRR